MQPTNQKQDTFFQNPPTPDQLREVELRKPAARAALIAQLAHWQKTGAISYPDLEDHVWPAEEQPPLVIST